MTKPNSNNQIDIEVLLPLLKAGWVAMDENGYWFWYKDKPKLSLTMWRTGKEIAHFAYLSSFNIKPAKDWEDSLMECGL